MFLNPRQRLLRPRFVSLNRQKRLAPSPDFASLPRIDVDCPCQEVHQRPPCGRRPADSSHLQYSIHSVPCIRFQVLFTLISKFFSSFAHATCSLSVFLLYLALDEFYHPICARVPTNTTLKIEICAELRDTLQGFHLLWRCFPTDLNVVILTQINPLNYNSEPA